MRKASRIYNRKPTESQQKTTNKNEKNEKNDKEERVINDSPPLIELLKPHIEKYGQAMIDKFINYWTQKNANGKKELWQMQKVFDVPKRLATWAGKEWNAKPTYVSKEQEAIDDIKRRYGDQCKIN